MSEMTGMRRLVLALPPMGASDESIRLALAIAASLRLDLLALLIEDERAFGAVAYGHATEFATDPTAPKAMDLSTLEAEFGLWARRLERRLAQAALSAQLTCVVERVRGASAAGVTARLGAADLLTVLEPSGALDRALGAQAALISAAHGVCAALTVPSRPVGATGAIVLLDTGAPMDAARRLAAALSAATSARVEEWSEKSERPPPAQRPSEIRLVIPTPDDDMALRRRLRDAVRLLIVPSAGSATPEVARVLALAARTGTPVLRLDSGGAGDPPPAPPTAPSERGETVRQSRARGPSR